MRIVHLHEGLVDPASGRLGGGLESSLYWLALEQRRRGDEVELWMLEPAARAAARRPELEGLVRSVPAYDHRRPDHLLALALRLRRARPDALHTHGYWAGAVGRPAAWLARVPARVHKMPSAYRREFRWTHRATERLLARLGGRVVAVSEDVRLFLVRELRLPASRVVLVPNGAPEPALPPDREACRAGFGARPGDFLILSLSRLAEGKGLPCLLEAAASLRAALPRVKLLLAGDGPLAARLRASAYEALGPESVQLPGWLADPGPALRAADAFVLGSEEREGLSTALLQAMASRLPAVATTVGGNPEALEGGACGLLVPPNDARALAEAFARLAASPEGAARLAARARARYEREYRLELCATRLRRLYEEQLVRAR